MQIVALSREDYLWVIQHGCHEHFALAGFPCAAWMAQYHKPGFYVGTGLPAVEMESAAPRVLTEVVAAYKDKFGVVAHR